MGDYSRQGQDGAAQVTTPEGQDRTASSVRRGWLASLWIRHGRIILWRWGHLQQRFQAWLRQFPRRTRRVLWARGLRRRLAITLAGAALMLALNRIPAQAATIMVANGEVAIADNGLCSLKEAIENANDTNTGQPHDDCAAADPSAADTIVLPDGGNFIVNAASGTYYGSATGLPLIQSSVTIAGNGSTIGRSGSAAGFRLLAVASSGDLTLNGLTIRGGYATSEQGGGGVFSRGTVTLFNTIVSGNEAYWFGGGISNEAGSLTLINSTVSGNSVKATGGAGGGIENHEGDVEMVASTVANNRALLGGGIHNRYGNVLLRYSLLSGNKANRGVEIYNLGTVAGNAYNLFGHSGYAGLYGATAEALDVVPAEPLTSIVDVRLLDHGGLTLTQALVANSPAVDAIPSALCAALPVAGLDQRGQPRGSDGNSTPSANECDIGAFEQQPGEWPVAIIVVANGEVNVNPNGVCGLAEAIGNANDTVTGLIDEDCAPGSPRGSDVIQLPANGSFLLTSWFVDERYPYTGLPVIEGHTVIEGNGSTLGRAPAADPFRLLAVSNSGSLILNQLTLTGGYAPKYHEDENDPYYTYADAGGVLSFGALTISGSTISGNQSFFRGGGIYSQGALTILDSHFIDNSAGLGGGVAANQGVAAIRNSEFQENAARFRGGGISLDGIGLLHQVVISGNTSTSVGGGLYLGFQGYLQVVASTISDNRAVGGGAAVVEGEALFKDSVLNGNEAEFNGGAIANNNFFDRLVIDNCTLSANAAGTKGGAIHNDAFSSATIMNSRIIANEAGSTGGGIAASSPSELSISTSIIRDNQAGYAGGGVLGHSGSAITITNSAITANSARRGGGLHLDGQTRIASSTIDGNSAADSGGGFRNNGNVSLANSTISGNRTETKGGGVFNTGDLQITALTAVGNAAAQHGGGLWNDGGSVALSRSLITGNQAAVAGEIGNANGGTVAADGYNLFGHEGNAGVAGFAPGTTDLIPLLALGQIVNRDLANHGGPTLTHALALDSPAIDAVPSAVCAATFDQRGAARNVDGDERPSDHECDMGAFEQQSLSPRFFMSVIMR